MKFLNVNDFEDVNEENCKITSSGGVHYYFVADDNTNFEEFKKIREDEYVFSLIQYPVLRDRTIKREDVIDPKQGLTEGLAFAVFRGTNCFKTIYLVRAVRKGYSELGEYPEISNDINDYVPGSEVLGKVRVKDLDTF